MAQNQVVTYPTPLYANVPINAGYYQPSQFFISGITLGATTTVTTTVNHNYVVGQLVRLLIPFGFGSTQLNEQEAYVIAIPNSNQVTLNLSSIGVNPFISATFNTQPQIVAVGGINTGAINNDGNVSDLTYIPGSFINISPE